MLGGAGYVEARSAGGFTPGFEPGPPLDKTQLSRLGSVAPSEVPVTPSPKAFVHIPPQRSVSMAAHADTTSQNPIIIGSSGRKLTYAEQQAYFPDAQYRDETLRTPLFSSPDDTDESILKKKTMHLENTLVDETQEVPQHPFRESEQGEPHGTARSSNTGDSEVDKSQAGETPPFSKPSPEGDMYSDGTYWKSPCSTIIFLYVVCTSEWYILYLHVYVFDLKDAELHQAQQTWCVQSK